MDVETESLKTYPGESASPEDLCLLAQEYRVAAHHLLTLGRPGEPLSRAPFRLTAIHAIELYLNAFLLHSGETVSLVRGLRHDMAKRLDHSLVSGLKLRKRTADHLRTLTDTREYLVSRYGPEMLRTASQLNRLTATLDEVAKKVSLVVLPKEPS